MPNRRALEIAAIALLASALGGCGPGDTDVAAAHEAVALADQEDAVCGMLVRAQSAPRGQIVHRDGSRFFFCSLGDWLVHLDAPSPHGRANALFVEVMEVNEDPAQAHTGAHPWIRAEDAAYVIGIDRPGIMGKPVLAYATLSEAAQAMESYGGAQVLDLPGLRAWWQNGQSAR